MLQPPLPVGRWWRAAPPRSPTPAAYGNSRRPTLHPSSSIAAWRLFLVRDPLYPAHRSLLIGPDWSAELRHNALTVGHGIGKLGAHFGHRILRRKPILAPQFLDGRGMLDELIRPADLYDRGVNPLLVEELQHRAAIAAHQHVVLQGDDHLCRSPKELGHPGIHRLDEAGIDEGHVIPFSGQLRRHLAPD